MSLYNKQVVRYHRWKKVVHNKTKGKKVKTISEKLKKSFYMP